METQKRATSVRKKQRKIKLSAAIVFCLIFFIIGLNIGKATVSNKETKEATQRVLELEKEREIEAARSATERETRDAEINRLKAEIAELEQSMGMKDEEEKVSVDDEKKDSKENKKKSKADEIIDEEENAAVPVDGGGVVRKLIVGCLIVIVIVCILFALSIIFKKEDDSDDEDDEEDDSEYEVIEGAEADEDDFEDAEEAFEHTEE